jgi:adenosylcobinamide-GDP ribazoletransferase
MNAQWRLFLTALRCFSRLPLLTTLDADAAQCITAVRFMPLVGAVIGAVGAAVYWIGAQIWPTSIAVMVSMLATFVISGERSRKAHGDVRTDGGVVGFVFILLIKYNALMALSAANLPFAVPANVALGVIMICGHCASRALVVSAIASRASAASKSVSHADMALGFGIGFAPATLMGIPGLMGLVAAIIARMAFVSYCKGRRDSAAHDELDVTQQLTEVCFYLAALATWTYV